MGFWWKLGKNTFKWSRSKKTFGITSVLYFVFNTWEDQPSLHYKLHRCILKIRGFLNLCSGLVKLCWLLGTCAVTLASCGAVPRFSLGIALVPTFAEKWPRKCTSFYARIHTVVTHRLGRKNHRLGHHFSWFSPHWVTFLSNQFHFIMPKLKVQKVNVPKFFDWMAT